MADLALIASSRCTSEVDYDLADPEIPSVSVRIPNAPSGQINAFIAVSDASLHSMSDQSVPSVPSPTRSRGNEPAPTAQIPPFAFSGEKGETRHGSQNISNGTPPPFFFGQSQESKAQMASTAASAPPQAAPSIFKFGIPPRAEETTTQVPVKDPSAEPVFRFGMTSTSSPARGPSSSSAKPYFPNVSSPSNGIFGNQHDEENPRTPGAADKAAGDSSNISPVTSVSCTTNGTGSPARDPGSPHFGSPHFGSSHLHNGNPDGLSGQAYPANLPTASTPWAGESSFATAQAPVQPAELTRTEGSIFTVGAKDPGNPRRRGKAVGERKEFVRRAMAHSDCPGQSDGNAEDTGENPSPGDPSTNWSLIDTQEFINKKQYSKALQTLIQAMEADSTTKPLVGHEAFQYLRQLSELFLMQDECHQQGVRASEEERIRLSAQVQSLKGSAEAMKHKKEMLEGQLNAESSRRHALEKDLNDSRQRLWNLDNLQRQNSNLQRQLRDAEARAKRAQNWTPRPADAVKQIAEQECKPLIGANDAERQVLKKKILLKWHPDKQPSSSYTAFATQVMQELQNRREWG